MTERRLAAILSADVVGYSRLMAEDAESTVRTLTAYREEVGLLVRQHRGRVVDSPGDNLLAEFPSALDAVRAAVEVQRVVTARNADLAPDRKMEFRIGVNLGDVLVEGERIYGDGVNVAARLEELAEASGICISGTVYEQVQSSLSVGCEDIGPQTVKNIPHPIQVYRLRVGPEDAAATLSAGTGESALTALAGRPDVAVLVVPAVWVFSVAVVFEILIMASPLAFYYYSAYGLSLNWLHGSPWTAWLTQFFLPHFSMTSSPFLNRLPPLGGVFILVGTSLFLVGFLQVYWAKIRRRDPVTGGLYAVLRHPQYVALAILGLGTLLLWPRFLVLISYITMLFLYTVLARWEEQRCLQKFPESYRAYLERTAGQLHRRLLARLPRLLPTSSRRRIVTIFALYAASIVLAVGVGDRVRDFSLSQLSSLYTERMAVISPAPLTQEELSAALRIASADPVVQKSLDDASSAAQLLVYVVPLEWEIADLPMELDKKVWGHHTPTEFDRRRYRVLFTKARTHDPAAGGKEILARAYGRDPMILVKVDLETEQVTRELAAQHNLRWGDIPTPLF